MEIIKKKIKQSLKLISDPSTGYGKIVPDLDANYFISITLTHKALDLGFFDTFEEIYGVYGVYGTSGSEYTSGDIGIGEELLMDINFI